MEYVKVRINAVSRRFVGYLSLPEDVVRISEALNSPLPYVVIYDDETGAGRFHALEKGAIVYVEALEEPDNTYVLQQGAGTFQRVRIDFAQNARLVGEVFVPANSHVCNVINDSRPFLNVRNAEILGTVEHYDFLAVSKRHATVIEGLDDGDI